MNCLPTKLKTGLLAGFLLLLQACVTAPQTESLLQQKPPIAQVHEILDVPFYPQENYYCGPTTLAEVLNFYGVEVDAVDVAPTLFIPARQGSLQIEMVASVRQFGFVAYAEQSNLEKLLSLVSDDQPIIVLQNLGTSWYPRWHYALVIGYDLNEETVIVHTGVTQRRVVAMNLFESTWRKGGYWMLAAMPPQKTSAHLDAFLYVKAAQDLMQVNQEDAATAALISATRQWPDYWLPYLLLGNSFLEKSPPTALHWFEKGLESGQDVPSYLNNYAYVLLQNGGKVAALRVIEQALALKPDDPNTKNSFQEILQTQDSPATTDSSDPE